jgi:hypothetical protein
MKKRGSGLVIHIEPNGYVVCTKGGRTIKRFRKMETAQRFAGARLDKTGGRSLTIKGTRLKYVPPEKAKPAKRVKRVKRRAKRRAKRRGRR